MNVHQIVEAVLFASDAPLTSDEIARADAALDEDQVEDALLFLRAEYDDADRSFELVELAEGHQILTRSEFAPYLERFDNVPRPSRLSGPALETLALLHISAESLPLEECSMLMPAPDRRWESHTIQSAVRILVDDPTYGHQGRRLLPVVELLLERIADQFSHWQQASRTLLHSDFNCSNVALERAGGGSARLIDWHIAASGMAAFDIASLFFQPRNNHINLDRRTVLRDYLEARHKLGGEPVHADEEWAAFCYATASDGLSYLPPVARQLQNTGVLQGWWSNILASIEDNLTWCASL